MSGNVNKKALKMDQIYLGTGASSCKDFDGLHQVLCSGIKSGIRHFDTAPSYKTERILGRILKSLAEAFDLKRDEYFIQTKIDPWQMQDGRIQWFVEDVLKQMDTEYLDSLLVHWPVPDYLDSTWKAFLNLYKSGIVKKIGVCNVRSRHIEKMLHYEFSPQIVQIERNPLRTCAREVELCHKHGIEIQSYSPLCKMDERIRDSEVIQSVAHKYSKSVGQIVLRWHLDMGVVPVFTSKRVERIEEYSKIRDFSLNEDEINAILELNVNYKMYLESIICPGF